MNDLINSTNVEKMLAEKQAILQLMKNAFYNIMQANKLMKNYSAHGLSKNNLDFYRFCLFQDRNEAFLENGLTDEIDKKMWDYLVEKSGILQMMDRKSRQAFSEQMSRNNRSNYRNLPCRPDFKLENIQATFIGLAAQREQIRLKGIADAFLNLDTNYKTNNKYKMPNKVIIHCFYSYHSYAHGLAQINDMEQFFYMLDNKVMPEYKQTLEYKLKQDWYAKNHIENFDSIYMKGKVYRNGNAHINFKRSDLIDEVNILVNQYLGSPLYHQPE